jgi:hypothetical protein
MYFCINDVALYSLKRRLRTIGFVSKSYACNWNCYTSKENPFAQLAVGLAPSGRCIGPHNSAGRDNKSSDKHFHELQRTSSFVRKRVIIAVRMASTPEASSHTGAIYEL